MSDNPLEAFLRERYERNKKIEEEQNQIPLFMTDVPDPEKQSDAYKSLKSIMDECDPNEIAGNLKESGNEAFKMGKNRWEDAVGYYTQALDAKPTDSTLKASIYSNRAQAQLSLGNYGKCYADAQIAIELDPTAKSYYRAAKSAYELDKLVEAGHLCRKGLALGASTDLDKLHNLVMEKTRKYGRIEREKEEKKFEEEERLVTSMNEINRRKIRLGPSLFNEIISRQGYTSSLYYDKAIDELHFSVLFLYPEFFQSDFIQDWCESITFAEQIGVMFPPSGVAAPWDRKEIYYVDVIEIYYEVAHGNENKKKSLHLVNPMQSLKSVLLQPDFVVSGINPVFYFVSTKSSYRNEFLNQYKNIVS